MCWRHIGITEWSASRCLVDGTILCQSSMDLSLSGILFSISGVGFVRGICTIPAKIKKEMSLCLRKREGKSPVDQHQHQHVHFTYQYVKAISHVPTTQLMGQHYHSPSNRRYSRTQISWIVERYSRGLSTKFVAPCVRYVSETAFTAFIRTSVSSGSGKINSAPFCLAPLLIQTRDSSSSSKRRAPFVTTYRAIRHTQSNLLVLYTFICHIISHNQTYTE